MAETVYLAATDEMASIKYKLDRARGNPIILIVPKTVKALRNPLTLKLVKRHAESLGKDLVLVTTDRRVRYVAVYHGVPVYASITQVRRWKPRTDEHPFAGGASTVPHTPRSGIGFAGISIAFLACIALASPVTVGYLVIPGATVTVYGASKALSENVSITASADAKAIDYQTGTIPGRVVEAFLEVTDQVDIAGKKAVPDAAATGQVTFVSKVDAKVTVPKGSVVSAKTGAKFRTADEAALPAAKGSSMRVAIIADQPGKVGNVERWTIDQIADPQMATQVSVVNENPTQGGTDKEVGAVTAQDRSRLQVQALAKAKSEMYQKLYDTKAASESIYPQTLNVQIVDEQFDRKVGDETKTLSIKLLVKGAAVAFEARDVNDAAGKAITRKVPAGMKLDGTGVKVKPLGAEKWSDRMVSFYAQAEAQATMIADEDEIKREVAGKSKEEAEKYLAETLALTERPEVKVEPDWGGTLPRFVWRIKVNLRVQ